MWVDGRFQDKTAQKWQKEGHGFNNDIYDGNAHFLHLSLLDMPITTKPNAFSSILGETTIQYVSRFGVVKKEGWGGVSVGKMSLEIA